MNSRFRLPLLLATGAVAGLLFAVMARAEVTVKDAWVRGTVAGQQATGAFMTLRSTSAAKVVGVASPAAKSVELHEMKMDRGVMRMGAVRELALPAGTAVDLQPGGYHVMLTDLARPLRDGDVVPITLTVEDAAGHRSQVEVQATVRPLTAPAMDPRHHGAHRN